VSESQKKQIKNIIELLVQVRDLPLMYLYLQKSPGKPAQNWINGFNEGIKTLLPDLYAIRNDDVLYKEILAERGWKDLFEFWRHIESLDEDQALDLLFTIEIEIWKRIKSDTWQTQVDIIVSWLDLVHFRPGMYVLSEQTANTSIPMLPAKGWLFGFWIGIGSFAQDLMRIEIASVYKDIHKVQGVHYPNSNPFYIMYASCMTELDAVYHLFGVEIKEWKRRLAKLESTD
jgi:hypothetical protein